MPAARFVIAAWVTATIGLVYAQSTSAVLTGTVVDSSGATVPDAAATLSSSDTGFIRRFTTGWSGQFVFPLLEPGQYQLRVEHSGFKLFLLTDILLGAGQAARVNPVLEVASEAQTVTVNADGRLIDAAAGLRFTLRREVLQSMPMQGRNFLSLAGAAPGVVGTGALNDRDNFAAEQNFDLSANGRNSTGNAFLLDGLNVTSNIVAGVTNLSPNPDSIQEYTVQTNTFTVEQGRASSLQVSMLTRGGTNYWHGAASYFFTNQKLAARTIFTDKYEPFEKHNIAAALGGPVIRDKLFFFASVEALRSNESQANALQTYESDEFVAFAKSRYPESAGTRALTEAPVVNVNTIGVAATARDVLGSSCGTPASRMLPCDMPLISVGQYRANSSRNGLQYSLRLDRDFSNSRDRVYGNFYSTGLEIGVPARRFGTETANVLGSNALSVSWIHSFSSTLLNEASFSRLRVDGDDGSSARYHLPEIDIAGQSTNISPGWGGGYAQHHYNWRDVLSWVRGRHVLKMGASYFWSDDSADFTRTTARPVFSFANLLDLLEGRPEKETGLSYDPISGNPAPFVFGGRIATAGAFLQDEWTVAPNFSLTLGIRWDDFGEPAGTHGLRFGLFSYASGGTLDEKIAGGVLETSSSPYRRRLNRNFSPRAGFAWSPSNHSAWRIHGGIGLYQDWVPLGQSVDLMRQNPPNYIFPTFRTDTGIKPLFNLGTSDTYPFGFEVPQIPYGQLDARGGLVGARPDIGFLSPDLSAPHAVNFLAGVERRFPQGLIAGVSYSGSFVPNALIGTDLNRSASDLLDGSLDRLNPSFGAMREVWNGNVIHYRALIATLRRDLGSRVSFQASYTLSETTDYTQAGTRQNRDAPFEIPDQHDLRQYESYADWDVRHRFALAGMWRLPVPDRGFGLLRWALSGWELSTVSRMQSGTPFSVVNRNPFDPKLDAQGRVVGLSPTSGDYNADGFNYDYPDAPARDFTGGHTRRQFLSGLFNAADFPTPAAGTNGNLKRNIYRNPGLLNVDAAFIRNLSAEPFGQNVRIQLRFEFFNALNRANLQAVDNDLGSATFGRSVAAMSPRVIQLGLRAVF